MLSRHRVKALEDWIRLRISAYFAYLIRSIIMDVDESTDPYVVVVAAAAVCCNASRTSTRRRNVQHGAGRERERERGSREREIFCTRNYRAFRFIEPHPQNLAEELGTRVPVRTTVELVRNTGWRSHSHCGTSIESCSLSIESCSLFIRDVCHILYHLTYVMYSII